MQCKPIYILDILYYFQIKIFLWPNVICQIWCIVSIRVWTVIKPKPAGCVTSLKSYRVNNYILVHFKRFNFIFTSFTPENFKNFIYSKYIYVMWKWIEVVHFEMGRVQCCSSALCKAAKHKAQVPLFYIVTSCWY